MPYTAFMNGDGPEGLDYLRYRGAEHPEALQDKFYMAGYSSRVPETLFAVQANLVFFVKVGRRTVPRAIPWRVFSDPSGSFAYLDHVEAAALFVRARVEGRPL